MAWLAVWSRMFQAGAGLLGGGLGPSVAGCIIWRGRHPRSGAGLLMCRAGPWYGWPWGPGILDQLAVGQRGLRLVLTH